ncbi:MAG TPA: arsenate reductase (glutaredoxin) [Nitrospiria bacterium]|nr:arsenate reductase (glutaredoxin) [Nitrospiria bacterium]
MTLEFFHNPRCGKSRDALKLLHDKGIEPIIRLYLSAPPAQEELADILKKLGISAKALIRFKEPVASELGIKPFDDRPEQEWVRLMVENPILIERPILISPKKAVIGRPPEAVLKLL